MKVTVTATDGAATDLAKILVSGGWPPNDVDLLLEEYLIELRRQLVQSRGELPHAETAVPGENVFRVRWIGNIWVYFQIIEAPGFFWRRRRRIKITSFREIVAPRRGRGR